MSDSQHLEFQKLKQIHPDKQDELISHLQEQNKSLKNKILEERFCWIASLATLILIGAWALFPSVWHALLIFAVYVVWLLIAAKRCGVDWAVTHLEKWEAMLYEFVKNKLASSKNQIEKGAE